MRTNRLCLASALLVLAAAASAEPIGRIKTVQGPAHVLRAGASIPARVGEAVEEKDSIATGAGGALGITFTDGTTFAAGPNSSVSLDTYRFDSRSVKGSLLARMRRGTLAVQSGEITKSAPDAMRIQTPGAILGVRGTRFLVSVGGPSGSEAGSREK